MIRRLGARFHYRLLPWLLRWPPFVVERWPALAFGTVRWLLQREVQRAAGPVLRALGRPATRLARWRFGWLLAYHQERHFLLTLQTEKLADAWIARQVRIDGALPPGGAILVAPHQLYGRLGYRRLQLDGTRLGLLASARREGWDPAHPDYAPEYAARGDRSEHHERRWHSLQGFFAGRVYEPTAQLRRRCASCRKAAI